MAKETDWLTSPSIAWQMMEAYRDLPRDLRGGAFRLQELGKKHLFRSPREREVDYKRRLESLELHPFYWSAMDHLGGQPFTRAIKWTDDTPSEIIEWANDTDGTGRDFRTVARQTCVSSAGLGVQFLFVVWDEDQQRPFIQVLPESAVLDPYEPGQPVRLRLFVQARDPQHPWVMSTTEQLWVLWDGDPTAGDEGKFARYEVYERKDSTAKDAAWNAMPSDELSGTFAPQTRIPLFPIATGGGGAQDRAPWVVTPPMHDLAMMQRIHMNKLSDFNWGLHIANVPQRAASGLTKEEAKEIDTVSYQGMWWMGNPSGKFYHVEHSGKSFEISMQDAELRERKMEVFGLSPMLSRANETATGRLIDSTRATTTAQSWALDWCDGWVQAWRCAARYRYLPDTFEASFYTEFGPKEKDIDRAKVIQQDYINGDLDPMDYFPEMQNLGVYSETFDAAGAATRAKKARTEAMKALAPPPIPPGAKPASSAARGAESAKDAPADSAASATEDGGVE